MNKKIIYFLAVFACLCWGYIVSVLVDNAYKDDAPPAQEIKQQLDSIVLGNVSDDDCDCIPYFMACGYTYNKSKYLKDSIHAAALKK